MFSILFLYTFSFPFKSFSWILTIAIVAYLLLASAFILFYLISILFYVYLISILLVSSTFLISNILSSSVCYPVCFFFGGHRV